MAYFPLVIYCDLSETIDVLKVRICNEDGITPDQQRLIFAGRELEGDKLISDYILLIDSQLHLVLRLRGGMYHETSGRSGNYGSLKDCIFYLE